MNQFLTQIKPAFRASAAPTARSLRPIWAGALLAVVLSGVTLAGLGPAENWPAWRGPRGDSTSQDTGLPVAWNEEMGVLWKQSIPAWGSSTPAIWENSLFLTTQRDDALLVLKLRASTGAIEWTRQFATAAAERGGPARGKQKFHDLHNLASPSPVTDGKHVVVHFGNGDLASYDFAGNLEWQRNLQQDFGTYTIWWGHANSPVLCKDLVISICMQDSLEDQSDTPAASYLVAHEIATGRVKWKVLRSTGAKAEEGDAYTTPVLAKVSDHDELIVMGANVLDGYEPADGHRLWYLPGLLGGRTVTGPTVGDGIVYATRGMRGSLVAVKLGGSGKLSSRDILWKYDGTPDTCCPVLWGQMLFTVTDDGVARAIDAASGRLHWKQRLKGDYKASPIAAEGRIYFLNTSGLCTIVSASDRFDRLAENPLHETTLASPAIADRKIFIRGRGTLYAIGKK